MSNYIRQYIPNSTVFITIITYNRQKILLENISLLRKCLLNAPYNYKIFACVVLPEHIHFLIKPANIKDLSKIISSIKYSFSKELDKNNNISESKAKKREKGIWHRRFYDHVIRDENDLNKHIDYIHYNPMKHYNIAPKDWEYSSFKKFVKRGFYDENWCNYDDKNKIKNLDLD